MELEIPLEPSQVIFPCGRIWMYGIDLTSDYGDRYSVFSEGIAYG